MSDKDPAVVALTDAERDRLAREVLAHALDEDIFCSSAHCVAASRADTDQAGA